MSAIMSRADQQRFDAWCREVSAVCGAVSAEARTDRPFEGSVTVRRLDAIDMVAHDSDARRVSWDAKGAGVSQLYCYLILQTGGRSRIAQCGRETTLARGDAVLVDSARPADLLFEDRLQQICFHIPRDMVTARTPDGDVPVMTIFRGRPGAGAVVGTFARSLFDNAPALGEEAAALRTTLLDLLLPPAARAEVSEAAQMQLKRLMAFIDNHLHDASLNPATVASAVGVSVRHAHRLFAQTGRSMSEWIRLRRLERARHDLADPRAMDRSILDIAFSWGFNDAAHFSRAFRENFGQAPRSYRKAALSAGQMARKVKNGGVG
jgi:AraC family transcriptional activator of tynA and feaB